MYWNLLRNLGKTFSVRKCRKKWVSRILTRWCLNFVQWKTSRVSRSLLSSRPLDRLAPTNNSRKLLLARAKCFSSLLFTLYSFPCTLHSAICTLQPALYTLLSALSILQSIQSARFTLTSALWTLQSAICNLQSAVCILQSARFTLNSALWTL